MKSNIFKSLGKKEWFIILPLVILDQITKLLIVKNIPLHSSRTILENFIDITHISNSGVVFGLFSQSTFFLKAHIMSITSIISIFFILFILSKIQQSSPFFSYGLSLILAGAFGNLCDRLFRNGSVVDFLDIHWYEYHWPSFNVADSCISIGVGLLIIDIFFTKEFTQEKQIIDNQEDKTN